MVCGDKNLRKSWGTVVVLESSKNSSRVGSTVCLLVGIGQNQERTLLFLLSNSWSTKIQCQLTAGEFLTDTFLVELVEHDQI